MKPGGFITGAGRGLGFALAKRFLEAGFLNIGVVLSDESCLVNLAKNFPDDLM